MSNVSPPDVTVGQVNPCAADEYAHADGTNFGIPVLAGTDITTLAPGIDVGRPIDICAMTAARSTVCCDVDGPLGESEPQPTTSAAETAAASERSIERVIRTLSSLYRNSLATLDVGRCSSRTTYARTVAADVSFTTMLPPDEMQPW